MLFMTRLSAVAIVCALALALTSNRLSADTISIHVAASSDDAEEHLIENEGFPANTVELQSTDLEIGSEGGLLGGGNPPNDPQLVGLRFLNVQIPAGVMINSASIQFTADNDDFDTERTSVAIFGELNANPATYSRDLGNISGRTRTVAEVAWNDIPSWRESAQGMAGPDQQTPDLTSIIQEIVDLPGWASGNPLAIMIGDQVGGERTAESFDGEAGAAALLMVVFTSIPESSTTIAIDVPDLTAPRITEVQIAGTDWSDDFLIYLDAAGLGSGGFSIPGGSDQLGTISWSNVNQIIIHFSEHVDVQNDDLSIFGVNQPAYRVSDFAYDEDSFTATWMLQGDVQADKLLLELSDRVHDGGDNPIDGNWQNGADTFPSGNGVIESDDRFVFRLNVLPGEAGSGGVTRRDLLDTIFRLGSDTDSSNYDPRFDFNGSGRIGVDDLRQVLARLSTHLPSGEPSTAGGDAAAVALDAVFDRIGAGGSPASVDVHTQAYERPVEAKTWRRSRHNSAWRSSLRRLQADGAMADYQADDAQRRDMLVVRRSRRSGR